MPDPETVVRSFFAAWPRRNMEEVLGYFTDDALYHNMPLEPVTGKDGIREILNMFLFSDQLEAELLTSRRSATSSSPSASIAMTLAGKRVVLPCAVAGVMEIRDDKIGRLARLLRPRHLATPSRYRADPSEAAGRRRSACEAPTSCHLEVATHHPAPNRSGDVAPAASRTSPP